MTSPCVDLCPKRDGQGHWWLCPTPQGGGVTATCKECGVTKEMVTGQEYHTGRFYGRKYRQGDILLTGPSQELKGMSASVNRDWE